MPHDVFLSYASADRAAADAVCVALEARGIVCWMAPRDVPAGADWGEAILTAIGRAHAMVLVLSRQTGNSVHVRNEVVTAVSQSLALVPVRVEDCQPTGALRLHLAGSHWLNVFPLPVEQHAEALAAGVRLALAADATIELPRAQAAALVAAARAAAGPVAAPGRPPSPPAAAQVRRIQPTPAPPAPAARPREAPAPAASRAPAAPKGRATPQARVKQPERAAAQHAPDRPDPAAGRGAVVALAVIAVLLVACLGAAAWIYEPQLRTMLGAGPGASEMADAADARPPEPAATPPAPAPIRQAAIEAPTPPAAPATPAMPGLSLPFRLPFGQAADAAAPAAPAPHAAEAAASPPRSIARAPTPGPALRLLNAGEGTITQLFVAAAARDMGQQDWLGSAQITTGNAVLVRAPAGEGCVFDIRVVYVGGATEDRPGVDLCSAAELRFEGGKSAPRFSRP